MKLYDISGNEIHGKEVVFERYASFINGKIEAALMEPNEFDKVIVLGSQPYNEIFSCYQTGLYYPMIFIGQLKDKI